MEEPEALQVLHVCKWLVSIGYKIVYMPRKDEQEIQYKQPVVIDVPLDDSDLGVQCRGCQ